MAVRATFTEFDPYKITGITVTDRDLGNGSYATVIELEYMGLKCAGKKIHELLLDQGDTSYAVRRFEEECHLLSQIRHPNIVQFLGVYFQQDVKAPILVMEFLSSNLTTCIERYGILIPKEISYCILYDVALGLCYLHSHTPPIIHRDLSSNNVLLSANMEAKISDLGVARILNLTPLQRSQHTQTPGTPSYMPPEVMVANPEYNTSLDRFSYGIMLIHVFSGKWPEPQIGPNRIDADKLIPVTEAERRKKFLQSIGDEHPLMDLMLSCINNDPERRACANEIAERLKELVLQFPASFPNRIEMLRHIETCKEEKISLERERDEAAMIIRQKDDKISELNEEIKRNELSHTMGMAQLTLLVSERSLQMAKYSRLENELADSVSIRDSALRRKEDELYANKEDLKKKDEIISKMNDQLMVARKYLSKKQQNITAYFSWKEDKDLPERISGGQAVVVGGKIYCGGQASKNSIYCYEPSQDNWTILPPLPVALFGVGQINGRLLAVGGTQEIDGKMHTSDEVYVYDERQRRWKHSIPSMPTARFDPGVLSLQSAIIVGGGQIDGRNYTNSVEILKEGEKPDTFQWLKTSPLPTDCCRISIVATGSTCYALGGLRHPAHLNQALYASVDDLLLNAVPAIHNVTDDSNGTPSPWKTLPHTLCYSPAAAILAGRLVAIGGWEEATGGARRKEVYAYSSSVESWIYIGDLPVPLARSIVATVSFDKLFVIGGYSEGGNVNTVYSGALIVDM